MSLNFKLPFNMRGKLAIPFPPIYPVTCNFLADETEGDFPFEVNFTDISSEITTTSWLWDFGDGSTGPERFVQNPTHTYTAEGLYTVSLTISGPEGEDTKIRTDYIHVLEADVTAIFHAHPVAGENPLEVAFTNESEGPIDDYLWDFGDGYTGPDQALENPTHEYTADGEYTVSLKVSNADKEDTETKVDYITVDTDIPAPVPDFTSDVTSGDYDLECTFDNTTTGIVNSWDWDFGDGSTHSDEFEPVHTYTHSGVYTVILKATGPDYEATKTRTNYITVTIPYADANFSFNVVSGNYPLTITPTDSSTYYRAEAAITAWDWDWGDGTTHGTTATPGNHIYEKPGTFTVILKVTNARGDNSETKTNYVTAAIPAIPTSVLEPELEVYLETTACRTVVTGTPNRLSHIIDLDGASHHDFTQGTTANRPEYDTATPTPLSPNGKQGARFNGDYVLEDNGGSNTFIDQNNGMFVAMVVGSLTENDDTLFAKWNASTDDRRFELMTNLFNVSKRSTTYVENASAIFTRPTGACHIIIARWEPGSYTKVWIDNVLAGTAVTPTTATLPDTVNCEDRIGSRGDGYALTTGNIWSIINYRDAMTDQDMNDVYYNLRARYIIT